MRIYPPEMEISPTEGFDAKKDIFNRAEIGKGLTNLVRSVSDPLVIALDGPWGCGKTTFLKMWAGELRKEQFPVVYFDAFANDFADDAFTAIASEIIGLLDEHKKSKTPAAKKFVKKAVGAGRVLLRSGIKVGVKAATAGLITAADLAEAAAGEAGDLTDKYIGELLTKQNEKKLTIEAFRDALAELPLVLQAPIQKSESGSELQTRPLIFIVDELDRCRPLFALELLERVKHFFAVPNVHFVLGSHLAQLHNSVVVTYGPQIDAQGYLEKFIHLTFMLAKAAEYRSERETTKFVNYLINTLKFRPEDNRTVELCSQFIAEVSETRALALRTIERIFAVLALALAFTDERRLRLGPILGGLCVLKVVHPDLYKKAKEGRLRYPDVEDVLGLRTRGTDDWAKSCWRYCSDESAEEPLINGFGREIANYGFSSRFNVVSFTANQIVDRLIPRAA